MGGDGSKYPMDTRHRRWEKEEGMGIRTKQIDQGEDPVLGEDETDDRLGCSRTTISQTSL